MLAPIDGVGFFFVLLNSPRRREILPPFGLFVHGRFDLELALEIMPFRVVTFDAAASTR